ncbi:LOW QUALITY PROTEIN: hypothetical protein V2J09_021783 [Rumex salicifolius]
MSQRSPARLASGRRLNRSLAGFRSSVRQLVNASINAEDAAPHIKAPQSLQFGVLKSGDLHPRFKGNRNSDPVRKKQARITCIRWTCPPKFILNDDWLLRVIKVKRGVFRSIENLVPSITLDVEGHHDDDHIPIIRITPIEDEEADPIHEVTPPSFVEENVNLEMFNGVRTSDFVQHQHDASVTAPKPKGEKHPLGTLTGIEGFEADIGAAVSVALTALIKSNEKGSLIDSNLLINILNDPKKIELLRVSRSPGHEKAMTPQVEAICSPFLSKPRQEKFYMMQPDLDRQSVLQFNNLLTSDQAKEGSIIHQTKMKLTSEILAPKHAIHSNKLQKKVHKASAETAVPKSEQPLPQKPENAVHVSLPVCKLPKSSVTMLTRASIIPLQEQPRNHFTTSRPPHPSFFSTVSLPGFSANQSKSQFDRNYKSLIRQHGLERREEAQEQRLKKVQASFPKPCRYFNSPKGCRLGFKLPL